MEALGQGGFDRPLQARRNSNELAYHAGQAVNVAIRRGLLAGQFAAGGQQRAHAGVGGGQLDVHSFDYLQPRLRRLDLDAERANLVLLAGNGCRRFVQPDLRLGEGARGPPG